MEDDKESFEDRLEEQEFEIVSDCEFEIEKKEEKPGIKDYKEPESSTLSC